MTKSQKICLASGDGHVGAPIEVYKDYLEKRLHPAFDEYYANHYSRWSPQSEGSFFTLVKWHTKMEGTEGFIPNVGTPVVWDPELRLKAMDQELVACEVLIPDDQNINDPPFGSGLVNGQTDGAEGSLHFPGEMVQAGARSYNRWLADFCSKDPARLRTTILGTLEHVVWCVDEVERAYESGLQTAVMLPLHSDLPLYHHPRYDILWDVCSELNLPVIVHIGLGAPKYLGEDPAVQRFLLGQEVFHHCQRALWTIIMGGVLERYPNLRVIPTEIGVDWVAPLLSSLDTAAEIFTVGQFSRENVSRRVDFSMKPSEYWQRQCFVTHSHSQRRYQFEGDAYDNVPNMVFGTDTGHAEGWWPVYGFPEPAPDFSSSPMFQLPVIPCEEAYETLWGGLPVSKMMPYLQDNFFRAFPNVDKAALDDVVERIGPTTADLRLV